MSLMAKTRLYLAALLALGLNSAAVSADSRFSPALTINGAAITYFEIEQRVALLSALGAPQAALESEAITQLTSDELKLQLGDRLGIEIGSEDIAAAIQEFAAQRNISADDFLARAADFGVNINSIEQLIRAGLVWRQIVQSRFRTQALPSESELVAALNIAAAAGRQSMRLAEIVLPFSERGQAETFAFAAELSDRLNSGGDFADAARTMSRSRSASADGDLDWLPADRLPDLIRAQVLSLSPGAVTGPIAFPQGVLLIKLVGLREESADRRPDIAVTYGEIIVTDEIGSLRARAAKMRTCADFNRFAAETTAPESATITAQLLALDPGIAVRIARLDAGEADVIPTANGASVLFLCERSSASDPELRDQLRAVLFTQRIAALGDGLLAELRRSAVIQNR